MTQTSTEKRAAFRALHNEGCFVLPNPWDAGSARMLQHLGFAALASTSAGYAWSTGRPDYAVTLEDVVEHLDILCKSVDLPVNADFENGFASDPSQLVSNVTLAIQAGVSGISIEDRKFGDIGSLYDTPVAVERIKAARKAIDDSDEDVILVGRTEGLLIDSSEVTKAIDKLVALAGAGADCLYAPGVRNKRDISAMVSAVAPKTLNVLAMGPDVNLSEFADLGVRRVSVGGALALVSWNAMIDAAKKIKAGSFGGSVTETTGRQLNVIFAE
jgi:2-methylisocitrate lyase-like PEP mutase family enzyme